MKSKMREILLVHFIVYACFCFIIILLLFIHALVFALPPSLSLSLFRVALPFVVINYAGKIMKTAERGKMLENCIYILC